MLLDPPAIKNREDGGIDAAKRLISHHLAPNRRADRQAKEKTGEVRNNQVGQRNQPDLRGKIGSKRKREGEGEGEKEGEGETTGPKTRARGEVMGQSSTSTSTTALTLLTTKYIKNNKHITFENI